MNNGKQNKFDRKKKVPFNRKTNDRKKEILNIVKDKLDLAKDHPANDIAWWSKYPDLLKGANNVIFNQVIGTRYLLGTSWTQGATSRIALPTAGLMMLTVFTPGVCRDANDPFNYQMRSLWLQLHRAYRGIGTYEYQDLGMAIMAILGVFADIARAERIYGVASAFKAVNRAYPNAILSALSIDAPTVQAADLADFRYQLNRVIEKAKMLCLPKGLSALDAVVSIYGNVFKDSEDDRAQFIVHENPFTLRYNATKFSTGGCVEYVNRKHSGTTYSTYHPTQLLSDIIDDLNTQIDILLTDTDIARICSDILKAFGNETVQLAYVPEDYRVLPVREDTRLAQLHNSAITGVLFGGDFKSGGVVNTASFTYPADSMVIYQEDGFIKQSLYAFNASDPYYSPILPITYQTVGSVEKPFAPTTRYFPTGDYGLDTWSHDPSGDDVVEMTRLAVPMNFESKDISGVHNESWKLDSYSLFIPMMMFTYSATPNVGGGYLDSSFHDATVIGTNASTLSVAMQMLSAISKLDWHPKLFPLYVASGTLTGYSLDWDIDNYTLISPEVLRRLHDACTLSAFKLSQFTVEG